MKSIYLLGLLSWTFAFPSAPFNTSGRDIVNANGTKTTFAGVNWPLSMGLMIPEGLQHQSVEFIVSKIKELGSNIVRFGYAIEMMDDIYASGDVTLYNTVINDLGVGNGTNVLNAILKNNPSFTANMTRFQVLDHIVSALNAQSIYAHMDNHVSKAMWCCTFNDGNAYFGDKYFDINNWKRGLVYMANWTRSHPNIISMSLRNELRDPYKGQYDWMSWYGNMTLAADGIHAANPDLLIYFSGLGYDSDLSRIPDMQDLKASAFPGAADPIPLVFEPSLLDYGNKVVLELHYYNNFYYGDESTCQTITTRLYADGFNAILGNHSVTAPVVLSEFGLSQDVGILNSTYAQCLKTFLSEQRVSWMMWVLAGSYYDKLGVHEQSESWGLLKDDWSDWRYVDGINQFWKPLVNATVS